MFVGAAVVICAVLSLIPKFLCFPCVAVCNIGLGLFLFSILPTDAGPIRWVSVILVYAFGLGAVIGLALGVLTPLAPLPMCGPDSSKLNCISWTSVWFGCMVLAGTTLVLVSNVSKVLPIALPAAPPAAPSTDPGAIPRQRSRRPSVSGLAIPHPTADQIIAAYSETCGTVMKLLLKFEPSARALALSTADDYYAMESRQVLAKLWHVIRWFWLACSVLVGSFAAANVVDGQVSLGTATGVAAAIFLLLAAVSDEKNRKRASAWLINLGSTVEEQQAAMVAAMIGGDNIADLLQVAKENFLVLPWRHLQMKDFAGNEDTGLNEKSYGASLGDCDAFISHSWHDNGETKWGALVEWAGGAGHESGLRAGGENLKVWLDKACINQKSISASLSALPVYLAGCQSLVIYAGPTWPLRLWCVLEFFTFLKMGGTMERVVLLTDEGDNGLDERLGNFDARNANCFLPEERERLLAVIETGFGDFELFNKSVREMLLNPKLKRMMGRAGSKV